MQDQDLDLWVKELENAPQEVKQTAAKRLRKLAGIALENKEIAEALRITALAKSLLIPCEGIDYMRGLAFLQSGEAVGAIEAFKEELRWFPHSQAAKEGLGALQKHMPSAQITLKDVEFIKLYPQVSPFTMVGVERLQTLFYYAKEICNEKILGNFVECGVAGGGSSGLLAWVLKNYDDTGRKLFCCDSFSGMPPSDENDTHQGVQAEDTNWGAGTCSAPESSVISLCEKLGASDKISIVKGYFCDTLPVWKEEMGPIAFLHMDGDWYSSTRDILHNLYDNLVTGAYVQVDDYGHWDGCRKAIHEFEKERGLHFEFTACDGTGVWFRKV